MFPLQAMSLCDPESLLLGDSISSGLEHRSAQGGLLIGLLLRNGDPADVLLVDHMVAIGVKPTFVEALLANTKLTGLAFLHNSTTGQLTIVTSGHGDRGRVPCSVDS